MKINAESYKKIVKLTNLNLVYNVRTVPLVVISHLFTVHGVLNGESHWFLFRAQNSVTDKT